MFAFRHSLGIIPLFVFGHFTHHVLTSITTPLLPYIRNDLGLDYTKTGVVSSAFMLAYGLGHLPAGWLADRFEPRTLMTVGISGVALAGLLIGFSHTYGVILFFLVLMGLLAGGYHPSAPALISSVVPQEHLGKALGFHNIGGGASHLVTPLVAVTIAGLAGWQTAFMLMALPPLLFGIFFYRHLGRLSFRRESKPEGKSPSRAGTLTRGERIKRVTVFLILITITGAIINSTISFLPLLFVDHFGLGKTMAAGLLSLLYLAVFWASPLGGNTADRLGSISVTLIVTLLVGPIVFFLPLVSTMPLIILMLLALGTLIFARMAAAETYLVQMAPPDTRATVLGIYFFAGMEGGAVLTPLVGYVIDHFGFVWAFTTSGMVAAAATLTTGYWLWEKPRISLQKSITHED